MALTKPTDRKISADPRRMPDAGRRHEIVDAPVEVVFLDGAAYRTHLRAAGDEVLTPIVLAGLACPAAIVPITAQ